MGEGAEMDRWITQIIMAEVMRDHGSNDRMGWR